MLPQTKDCDPTDSIKTPEGLEMENDKPEFYSLSWWKSFLGLLNKTCWFSAWIIEIIRDKYLYIPWLWLISKIGLDM